MKIKKLPLLLLIFIISSCGIMNESNPFNKYSKVIDGTKYKKVRDKDRDIYKYTSKEDVKYFLEKGYILKAQSAFRYTYTDPSWLDLAAKNFGAQVVLAKQKYAGSQTGTQRLIWRVPGETYKVSSSTKGSVSYNSQTDSYVYGSSGSSAYGHSSTYGNGSYSSTTTTIIQEPDRYRTQSVPYRYDYYDYYAVFLVKKYYWANKKTKIYADKKLTQEVRTYTLKPKEWFEVLKKSAKYIKISYRGVEMFISGNTHIY